MVLHPETGCTHDPVSGKHRSGGKAMPELFLEARALFPPVGRKSQPAAGLPQHSSRTARPTKAQIPKRPREPLGRGASRVFSLGDPGYTLSPLRGAAGSQTAAWGLRESQGGGEQAGCPWAPRCHLQPPSRPPSARLSQLRGEERNHVELALLPPHVSPVGLRRRSVPRGQKAAFATRRRNSN